MKISNGMIFQWINLVKSAACPPLGRTWLFSLAENG
jgi:hypothetical protein